MNTDLIILHLSLIDKVGPAVVKYLINKKPKSFKLEELYACSLSDLKNIFGLNEPLISKIYFGLQDKDLLENELKLIEKHKISWTTFLNDDYPALLKNIHLPPTILYWQGAPLKDTNKNIAVIGSRKVNSYGIKVINMLVKPLVQNGWTIVSGGALGADTVAHQAALNAGGKTIVILGSGLLKPYPYVNKKLFSQIVESGGAIVSSFPLMVDALPGNFPARNRIISGMSKGCVVAQAAIKSGTRITALYALDQGREVFAIPGQIDDELSQGCHKLIQEGAKLVFNVEDILQEFGESSFASSDTNMTFIEETVENKPGSIDEKIVGACKYPVSIDELCQNTGLDLAQMQTKLFELQLDGQIEQNLVGLWHRL